MVDTGAAITLLTKKWADAHRLPVKEKAAEYISGANGTVVKIIGTNQHDPLTGSHPGGGRVQCRCLFRGFLPRTARMQSAVWACRGARRRHY